MKKVLILVIIVFGLIKLLSSPSNTPVYTVDQVTPEVKPKEAAPKPIIRADRFSFRCDGRQHCSQMRSFEEAQFFLRNCPDTKMDGDNDGIPCERQFHQY